MYKFLILLNTQRQGGIHSLLSRSTKTKNDFQNSFLSSLWCQSLRTTTLVATQNAVSLFPCLGICPCIPSATQIGRHSLTSHIQLLLILLLSFYSVIYFLTSLLIPTGLFVTLRGIGKGGTPTNESPPDDLPHHCQFSFPQILSAPTSPLLRFLRGPLDTA